MKPLPHQEKFAKGYNGKRLIVHEGGTGKTICACLYLADGRDEDALVICPKRVVSKWQTALKDWSTKATVVSKEQFKKMTIKKWSALIVDEADEFASPLFGKGRSQLSVSLYNLIKEHEMPTLLLTATPIRSHPWNLHTLLCFLRIYIPYKLWRDQFFHLVRRPYVPRPFWEPKPDWRTRIRPTLLKYADIVLLSDCVGNLPSITENTLKMPYRPFEEDTTDWEPMAAFVAEHKHEQQNKVKKILEIAKDYRKVLVVAYYVEQVRELEKELSKDREAFTVYGAVKNQEELLKKANETDECFLIVQASLGAGFDADSFSCVIFASMSYKVRDYVQMKYRVRRIHNLHPVSYTYLIGGRCDERIYDTIQLGKDFVPSEWCKVL